MAIKTVLEYVQGTLNVLDGDNVDSINEVSESMQVATLLADCYDELMNRQEWAFLKRPVTLVAAGDSAQPTRFDVPPGLRRLSRVWYNVSESGTERRELKYVEPECFLTQYASGAEGDNKVLVTYGSQLQFYVRDDRMPSVYTTFDDRTIWCDAYEATIETSLVTSRVSAWGVVIPAFSVSDSFVPDLPEHMVPLLQATLNATASLHFKQVTSAPDEARVRRQLAQARTRNQAVASREHYYANRFGRR